MIDPEGSLIPTACHHATAVESLKVTSWRWLGRPGLPVTLARPGKWTAVVSREAETVVDSGHKLRSQPQPSPDTKGLSPFVPTTVGKGGVSCLPQSDSCQVRASPRRAGRGLTVFMGQARCNRKQLHVLPESSRPLLLDSHVFPRYTDFKRIFKKFQECF